MPGSTTMIRTARLPLMTALAAGALSALLPCCSPDSGFNTVADYDVVATHFNPETDFGAFNAFALPDTVVHLRAPDGESGADLSRDYDSLIVATIRENIEAMGYRYVPEESLDLHMPDVFVLVSASLAEWATGSGDWWERWGWYPHWPGRWGPGWRTYYPYPINYFYRSGTVFIDMFDPQQTDPEAERIFLCWTASINGLMVDMPEGARSRIVKKIDQAFIQSPYLAGQ